MAYLSVPAARGLQPKGQCVSKHVRGFAWVFIWLHVCAQWGEPCGVVFFLAQNAPNHKGKKSKRKKNYSLHKFCIETPDWLQWLQDAYCCDKQMDMVHFYFSSWPINPTSQTAVLIKCRWLQGSTVDLLKLYYLWWCSGQKERFKLLGRCEFTGKRMSTAVIKLQCNLSYIDDCNKGHKTFVFQETLFCVTQVCSIFCFSYNEISELLGSLSSWCVVQECDRHSEEGLFKGLLWNTNAGC